MIPLVSYPLPLDNWDQFERPFYRFIYTLKMYLPEEQFRLIVPCCGGEPTDEIRRKFYGIHTTMIPYGGFGADIGAHQFVARAFGSDEFMVCLSSRCYFHRAGWLKRFLDARKHWGEGIFGTGTFERRAHIRSCAMGIDSQFLAAYPTINSREDGGAAEWGEDCLTAAVEKAGGKTLQVLWDGEQLQPDWRDPHEVGLFRRGNQECMLVWDRHTEIYRDASPEEKTAMSVLSDPQH